MMSSVTLPLSIRRALLGVAAVVIAAAPLSAQPESPPRVVPSTVLKAAFQTTVGAIEGVGTGFFLQAPGRGTVFVTALHVFGPPAGLAEWIPSTALPEIVESGVLDDAFTQRRVGRVLRAISTPEASLPTADGGRAGLDFAVFQIADSSRDGFLPAEGSDPVLWIVSPGLPDGVPLRVGRVAGPSHFVSVAIPDALILPIGISGSPIVTAAGEVVALVTMLGEGPDGERVIHATPIETVMGALGTTESRGASAPLEESLRGPSPRQAPS